MAARVVWFRPGGPLAIWLLVAAVGCARKHGVPESPPPEVYPEEAPGHQQQEPTSVAAEEKDTADFSSVEQAEAELRRAREALEVALAPPPPASPATGSSGAEARPPAGTPPEPRPEKKAESPCETACRALASLERAAAAVCRLAGEADARCTRAKQTVAESSRRVAACGCPAKRP
jgi:hypothetical protein